MKRNSCHNCINSVGSDFCTRRLDMKVAKYKKCDGWILQPKRTKKEIVVRKTRYVRDIPDDEISSNFLRFIKKGGHFSMRTGKIIVGGEASDWK